MFRPWVTTGLWVDQGLRHSLDTLSSERQAQAWWEGELVLITAFQQSNKTQLNRHWSPFPTFSPTYVYKQKYNQAYLIYKIGLVETNQLCMVMLESSITHKCVISCLSLTNLPKAAGGHGGGTLGGQRQADLWVPSLSWNIARACLKINNKYCF